METKKDIIADAGMELTDDELEMVAGGRPYGGLVYSQEGPLKPKQ